ncbi:MAG: Protein of unknown function (DUF3572) [Rhodobacteraceae bacterium HLUCCA12]|nr:MAG: Protein of unknown function (DUF3572) [Rhodobacteraceae bacterium HLUCCA12]
MAMNQANAEFLAVRILGWLAEDHARIGAFLAASGTAPGMLRARASDPDFLLAVIEFLMADEAMMLDCCAALEIAPHDPAEARAHLPGGATVHWT